MPSFANPFTGNIPRKMTNQELLQALRIDIASELEAIYLYDAHAHATDDPVAKAVLLDIRDEEVQHCGELFTVMRYLDPAISDHLMEGEGEVRDMMRSLGISPAKIAGVDTSVGSLLGQE